jgi:hypothetical protein
MRRPALTRAQALGKGLPLLCVLVGGAAAADPSLAREAVLAATPPVAAQAPARPTPIDAAPSHRHVSLDRDLDEIEAVLAAAHFRTALALSRSTRALLGESADRDDDPALRVRRARLELMTATAELALGRRSRAREALARARRAHPVMELDERTTSPKLVAIWRSIRSPNRSEDPRP